MTIIYEAIVVVKWVNIIYLKINNNKKNDSNNKKIQDSQLF